MTPAIRRRSDALARFLRQRDVAAARTMAKHGRTAVAASAIVRAAAMRQRRALRWGRP